MSEEQVTKIGSEPRIWAVAGGKGGVGKSVISTLLAYWLARTGKRTVLVDLDLGGATIHTLMGIKSPPENLYDFVSKRYSSLEDICLSTPVENLRLIAGASEVLSLANPQFNQKVKLIKHLVNLNADYVVLDLGAGTSFNVLDFFLAANEKIVVLAPEPTSIQNAYILVRNSVYRMLSRLSRDYPSLQAIIKTAMDPGNKLNIRTVSELLEYVEEMGGDELADSLKDGLGLIRPAVAVNMVSNHNGKKASRIIQITSEKYLMIESVDVGSVAYDGQLSKMIAKMAPLVEIDRSSTALADIYAILGRLLGHREPDRTSVDKQTIMAGQPSIKTNHTKEDSSYQEVRVRKDNSAIVICPQCGLRYTVNAGKVTTRGRSCKLRCKCGHGFSVFFEFRETPRREYCVEGHYRPIREVYVKGGLRQTPMSEGFSKMLVKNISRNGIGFVVPTGHELQVGDTVEVMFALDDAQRSHVERTATVRWIGEGNHLGCEFTDFGHVDRATGFYVMT